jgi:hypothetical protein
MIRWRQFSSILQCVRLALGLGSLLWVGILPDASAQVRVAPSIVFSNIGTYRHGGGHHDRPAPDTTLGFTRTFEKLELEKLGRVICAKLGVSFGASYAVSWPGRNTPITLTMRTRFPAPGIRTPAGRLLDASRFEKEVAPGGGNTRTFTFDEPFEIVAGVWSFEYWYEDVLLGSVEFEVRTDCHAIS